MLAKTWKTILLVVCVIAVMFNIISKIVRAPSFQKNLDTVIEENIISIDATEFSNTIESAGKTITESAKEITSTLFNSTSNNSVQEEQEPVVEEETPVVEEQEEVVSEYNNQTEDKVETEGTSTNENSRFQVSFN